MICTQGEARTLKDIKWVASSNVHQCSQILPSRCFWTSSLWSSWVVKITSSAIYCVYVLAAFDKEFLFCFWDLRIQVKGSLKSGVTIKGWVFESGWREHKCACTARSNGVLIVLQCFQMPRSTPKLQQSQHQYLCTVCEGGQVGQVEIGRSQPCTVQSSSACQLGEF